MGSTKLILALACLCFLGVTGGSYVKVPETPEVDEGSLQKNRNVRDSAAPPPPPQCVCGKVNPEGKIVGGDETEVLEYPWQVYLLGEEASPVCGGSIISNQWILTAAHCIDGQSLGNLSVVLAEHDWSTNTETSATETQAVSQLIMHPGYNSTTSDNDMALIKLSDPIAFNSDNKIAPVCLPEARNPYDNVDATVTGWGTLSSGGPQPNGLYKVTLPTLSEADCQKIYPDEVTENMICTGDVDEGGISACHGDSGGPMITDGDDEGTYVVEIGVFSWSYGCAEPGLPGVYARVNMYLDWIEGHISGSTVCPIP